MADSVDSWIVPVAVEIPFPRLGVTGVNILDDTGNNDGKLDPNETAQLEILISNSGGQNANGVVSGELSILPTSTASATVVNDNPSFGFVNVGSEQDEDDFFITVTSGTVGDVLECALLMEDNVHTYQDTFSIVLGEAPWLSISPLQDDPADSLDQSVDIVSVEYRVVGTEVEFRLQSSTILSPTGAFVEAWGRSGGAGHTYFRWVVQSGVGTLQGYNSGIGFQPLGNLEVDFPDDYHMIMTFDTQVFL